MSFIDRKADTSDYCPGITLRSLAVMIFCMIFAGIYTNYSLICLTEFYLVDEMAIPFQAIIPLLGITLFVGFFAVLFKIRLLTKPELVCVVFATMMASTMMSQGFWHRFVGIMSGPVRNWCFDYIDAYDDKLWPHGDNLFEGSFEAAASGKQSDGHVLVPETGSFTNITWSRTEYEEGCFAVCPTILNTSASDETFFTFRIKPGDGENGTIAASEQHMLSLLTYVEDMEAESKFFCRTFSDGNPVSQSLLSYIERPQKNVLHKKGFVRIGSYGMIPSRCCTNELVVQLGFQGRGRATMADIKLFSVAALESAYNGRKIIDEEDYLAMPENLRPTNVVIRPKDKFSWKTVTFYLKGYIPLRHWLRPALIWGSFVTMLVLALFCVNVIMRRKWAESERYPMPNTRIPLDFIGVNDDEDSPFSHLWRNRYAWTGFVLAVIYGLAKGWHSFNPNIPDINIAIPLNEYISNPIFGDMFHTEFIFGLTICCIAIFFDLNVLMSLVLGYWSCRAVYFLGHVTRIDANTGFPWRDHQAVGSYIGYFIVVIALSWKYILGVIRHALNGTGKEKGEVFSPRTAVIIFLLCHIGVVFWSLTCGASMLAMLIFFSFLVMLGFVSAKYRAECGTPFGYFTPYNCMLFVGAIGGISLFGTKGMYISLILSGCLTVTVFYLIPGMQFEMIEIGNRMKIRPRHILYTCLIGFFGGLFIGGWTFLTHGYATGSENLAGGWFYSGFEWFTGRIREPIAQATNVWLQEGSGEVLKTAAADWGQRAMYTGGLIMIALTLLRQFFSGFWFHPVGFMLGWTNLNDGAPWGTLLVAWIIRYTVLKIGGAKAVRNKLFPFFTGAFAGCAVSIVFYTVVNGISVASGSPDFYRLIP